VLVVTAVFWAGVAGAQVSMTGIAVRSNAVSLAWTASTDLCLVVASPAIRTNSFQYVGDVLATNSVSLTNASARCFYRLRRVSVVGIPDANFEAAIREAMPVVHRPLNFDYDVDLAGVTNLDVDSAGIEDATGLKALTGLVSLSCDDNFLTDLDVSSCAALADLSCRINLLSALDLSACTNLLSVACDDNSTLSSLALRSVACTNLSCARGALTALDLSHGPALVTVDCSDNTIGDLNLIGCGSLKSLNCDDNLLTSLDLSDAGRLTWLSCNNSGLSDLDLASCVNLQEVYAENNAIQDVSSFGLLRQLRVIDLYGNPIETLQPLIDLASGGWLVGCQLFVSGPTIDYNDVLALRAESVVVTYHP